MYRIKHLLLIILISFSTLHSYVEKKYYNNFRVKSEISYSSKGIKNGIAKYYDSKGSLLYLVKYSNNLLNGPYLRYYPNGIKNIEGMYKNGKVSGLFKQNYSNGKSRVLINYQNGKKNGLYKYFYDDKLALTINYLNDEKNGEYKKYYSNGKLELKRLYRKNILVDNEEFYTKNGNLKKIVIYNNRGKKIILNLYNSRKKMVKNIRYNYDSNNYKNYTKVISYYYLDNNNFVRSIESYKNSTKNGIFIDYYRDSTIHKVSYYVNGKFIFLRTYRSGLETTNQIYNRAVYNKLLKSKKFQDLLSKIFK